LTRAAAAGKYSSMTAELPRCAGCRVTIEPGQNVLFRTDGRVQHVACPEIACPVCSCPIVPTDPIRRDGDQLLHGNCWMRRTLTPGQRDFHPRRAIIRAKLAAGLLPMSRPDKTWGGYGSGKPCDVCGDRIAMGQVEYQVGVPDFEMTLRVHPECMALWYEQCPKESRKISGGSAA
jgi:hypothetical protein